MKKRYLFSGLTALCMSAGMAMASEYKLTDWDFVAPSVVGAENIDPASIGLIVFDASNGDFRGYTGSAGWVDLSSISQTDDFLSVSSSQNIAITTDVVLADSSGGAFAITLADASTGPGKIMTFKKTSSDSNLITIDGFSSQTIDGELATALVTKNGTVQLLSDGTNWRVTNLSDSWKVDANIAGANPNLGVGSESAYVPIEDSGLTLTNNTGLGNITAQIPCSSTNSPTGTTCSVGNESIGVSFTLPRPGSVRACVNAAHQFTLDATSDALEATFEIVETPSNAQTISQEGNGRVSSGANGGIANVSATRIHPLEVCGDFTFSTAGQKTLRLFYEQSSAAANAHSLIADASSSRGQRDVHITVYPTK